MSGFPCLAFGLTGSMAFDGGGLGFQVSRHGVQDVQGASVGDVSAKAPILHRFFFEGAGGERHCVPIAGSASSSSVTAEIALQPSIWSLISAERATGSAALPDPIDPSARRAVLEKDRGPIPPAD